MKIIGCISTFEAEKTLGRALDSLRGLVDNVIIVDGAWEGFADYPESKDATVTVAKSYETLTPPLMIIRNSTGKPYASEMEKRNQYLNPELLHEGDWLIWLDDDEYATQGMSQTRKFLEESKLTHHTAVVWRKTGEGKWSRTGEYVRCIRYVPGMRYGVNPWTIELPNGTSIPMTGTPTPLHIAHEPLSKPKEYQEMKVAAIASGNFGNNDKSKDVKKVKGKRKTGNVRQLRAEPQIA